MQTSNHQQPKTAFAAWMAQTGLKREEAAELLGVTPKMVSYWIKGEGPRGRAAPLLDTRRLMTVIAEGRRPEPWPE